MIVITLRHPQEFDFLRHVFEQFSMKGMPAEQLAIAAGTYQSLMAAQDIPLGEANLGKATSVELGPNGVALEFEQATGG